MSAMLFAKVFLLKLYLTFLELPALPEIFNCIRSHDFECLKSLFWRCSVVIWWENLSSFQISTLYHICWHQFWNVYWHLHFTKISEKQTHFPRTSILGKKNTTQGNGQPIASWTHRKKYISDGVIEAWSFFDRSRGRSRGGARLKHSDFCASKYFEATVKISLRF